MVDGRSCEPWRSLGRRLWRYSHLKGLVTDIFRLSPSFSKITGFSCIFSPFLVYFWVGIFSVSGILGEAVCLNQATRSLSSLLDLGRTRPLMQGPVASWKCTSPRSMLGHDSGYEPGVWIYQDAILCRLGMAVPVHQEFLVKG